VGDLLEYKGSRREEKLNLMAQKRIV
jgi:hypothetical protein